ncbi:MAG: beta-galactosidase, partial [Victivallaceae bacterium]|nr:beta-galactosidase [Victivallaceae bacterium]
MKMRKKFFVLAWLALVLPVLSGGEVTPPSWMKIHSNGCFEIGDIRAMFSVGDGRKGASEMLKNSKCVGNPSTIELDSRIWLCKFQPWEGPQDLCTIRKKLTVHGEDAVNWRYQLDLPEGTSIRTASFVLMVPASAMTLFADGKKWNLPGKYEKTQLFAEKVKALRIPVNGSEIEISGDFYVTISDLRRWGDKRFVIALSPGDRGKVGRSTPMELDFRYQGIRVSRKAFDGMNYQFTPIPLDKAVNNTVADPVADDGVCGWTDKGPDDDLRAFQISGNHKFGSIPFLIADPKKNQGRQIVAVAHAGRKLRLPEKVTIPVEKIKARGLYFLHASAWASEVPGHYIIGYEDGSSFDQKLIHCETIANWWTAGPGKEYIMGWSMVPGATQGKGLVIYPWSNPYPDKAITSITLQVSDPTIRPKSHRSDTQHLGKSMVLLAGITAVNRKPLLPQEEAAPTVDDSKWIALNERIDEASVQKSILDVSDLVPAPAGKFGPVSVDGEKFRFADNSEARFLGMVIASHGKFLLMGHTELAQNARKLRGYGVNIVRIIGVGGDDPSSRIFQTDGKMIFDPERIDRLFYFLSELKKNGIYVELDLTPGRVVRDFEYPEIKGVNWVNNQLVSRKIRTLQKQFTTRLLTARNPYTNLSIAEDPGIAILQIANETSLLYPAVRDAIKHPEIRKEFTAEFQKYLLRRYSTREALDKAWNGALRPEEDPKLGTVALPDGGTFPASAVRTADLKRFYAELNTDYFREMVQHLRSLKYRSAILGSNHWTTEILDFYANTRDCDVFDRHAYWAHPVVDNGWNFDQVLFNPNPSVKSRTGGIMESIASRRVAGRPYALTEWSVGATNEYHVDASVYLPAYASMHNWTLFQFEYTMNHGTLRELRPMLGPFTLSEHYLKLAFWPATATMFHRKDVREAERGYYEKISYEEA